MATVKTSTLSFPVRATGRSYIEGYQAPPAFTTNTATFVAKRIRSGVSLPKWETIIANGGNATTPLTAEWESVDYTRDDCTLRYKSTVYPNYTYIRECRGDLPLVGLTTLGIPTPYKSTSEAYNEAAAAFRKKLKAQYQTMSGLVALGEMRETLQMLKRPALGLQKISEEWIKYLKRKHKNRDELKRIVRNSPKYLADAWLEKSFGWDPLWNDAKDAVQAYKGLTNRILRPDSRIISAGAMKTYDLTSDLSGAERPGATKIVQNGPTYVNIKGIKRETHIVRFKGRVDKSNETTEWDNTPFRAYGLDIREFVPTMWELLPWSFLIDYFSNIGDCLESVTTFTGNVAYVNTTVIQQASYWGSWKVDTSLSRPGGAGNWFFASQEGKGLCHNYKSRRTVGRSAGTGVPMPRIQFSFDLSDRQLGNIAALLGSALGLSPQRRPFRAYRLPGM